MASDCCESSCSTSAPIPPRYRRALWIALLLNVAMFLVEVVAGWHSHSAAMIADAVDFFADAANFGISLFALTLAAVWRSRAALLKGVMMGVFAVFVLGQAGWHLLSATVPDARVMGAVSLLAIAVNGSVAVLLYSYRTGDANMRSVFLCARNDAIGNLAVMAAALGVFGTQAGWPDAAVALGMAVLGISSSFSIIRQARMELRQFGTRAPAVAAHP